MCISPIIRTQRRMANQDEIELLTAEVASLRQQLSQMQGIESQRREAQDRYSGILDIAHEGIVSVDDAQIILVFNHGAEIIFGYAADEVLGKSLSILMPSRIASTHHRHMADFASSSIPTRRMAERSEVYGLRKDGEEFPAEASISKLEEDGRQIFTVILRDISDRKQAEAALLTRTQELERSNRELEQFANVASHDLQEPLRMVTGYVKLLARRYQGQLDSDADEFIGYAVDGVDRMRDLINDILTYSQLGASGQTSESIDLKAIVEIVLRNVKDSKDDIGATITGYGPHPVQPGT
jgi:PAS domain S-box-containing protein